MGSSSRRPLFWVLSRNFQESHGLTQKHSLSSCKTSTSNSPTAKKVAIRIIPQYIPQYNPNIYPNIYPLRAFNCFAAPWGCHWAVLICCWPKQSREGVNVEEAVCSSTWVPVTTCILHPEALNSLDLEWGFPKTRGTRLGGPPILWKATKNPTNPYIILVTISFSMFFSI